MTSIPSQCHPTSNRWLPVLVIALLAWHTLAAVVFPVTQDEAYYLDWSRHLAWGYFDHPPGVALLGSGIRLAPGVAWAGRLGTLLVSALTLFALFAWYRRSGLSGRTLLIALLLAAANIPVLAYGFIDNPDVLLLLFWALAMHEATVALQGRRRRWLSVGVLVGLGLLSKYTMVLILPVLLWGLWRGDRGALHSRWPWIGALLAALIVLPNMLWNLDQCGGSLIYQLYHGFGKANEIVAPSPISGIDTASAPQPVQAHRAWPGIGGILSYLGGQSAMLGVLLLPFPVALVVRVWRRRNTGNAGDAQAIRFSAGARSLLIAGTLVPLVFFAVIAAVSKVQANWPVPWLLSAAPLAAVVLRGRLSWVFAAALANLLLLSLLVVHARSGVLPLQPAKDRVLRETQGYRALARMVGGLSGPVFADRYQLTAMLRFYAPSLPLTQWPGISRSSEYLRGALVGYPTLSQLQAAGGFWLVTRHPQAPAVGGFEQRLTRVLYDCKGDGVSTRACPDAPVHRWFLYRYRVR